MNIGVGALTSFQTYNQYTSCDATLYVTYALYIAYRGSLILLRPYLSPLDNAYYISVSVLQLSVLTINVAQSIKPELQDNQDLNNAKQWIIDSLYYITLVRGVFDFIKNAKDLCNFASKLWNGAPVWRGEGDVEMSLLSFFPDGDQGVSSSSPSAEVAAPIPINVVQPNDVTIVHSTVGVVERVVLSNDAIVHSTVDVVERVVPNDVFSNYLDLRPDLLRIGSEDI